MAAELTSDTFEAIMASATETERTVILLLTKMVLSLPTLKRELDTSNYMVREITFHPQPEWDEDDLTEELHDLSEHDDDPLGESYGSIVSAVWSDIQQEETGEWRFTISWSDSWLAEAQAELGPDDSAVAQFLAHCLRIMGRIVAKRYLIAAGHSSDSADAIAGHVANIIVAKVAVTYADIHHCDVVVL